MTREDEIRSLIDELRTQENYDEAFISFISFDEHDESFEGYIKANPQGLKLFAADLLDASISKEKISGSRQLINHQLDIGIIGEDSHYSFEYVQIELKKRHEISKDENYKVNWKDQVFKAGCLLVGLILVALIIVGAISVFSWFGDVFNPSMD